MSVRRRVRLPEETGILGVLVVVAMGMALLSPTFGTFSNTLVLLLNGAVIGFLAIGQTFVLLTGGIDLSTAANMALSGVLGTLFMSWGLPWHAAVALALCVALAFGIANGLLVRYVGLPAFIATFGVQGVVASLAQVITKGVSITAADERFVWLGRGKIASVPVPVVLLLFAALIAAAALKWTRLGVHIYAFGGNPRAARLAGVNTARTTLFVYGVSGFCAGIGGLITASRLMVGFPYVGSGNELFYSIAAAVVGGVSLFGGVGTVLGTIIGAVLIATVSNGMNVLNISSYWQPMVIGAIILGAVSADTYRRTMAGRNLWGLTIAGFRLGRGKGAEAPPQDAAPRPAPDREVSTPERPGGPA
jgi:ribose transport system permease protein